jgi:hypothetical protein
VLRGADPADYFAATIPGRGEARLVQGPRN